MKEDEQRLFHRWDGGEFQKKTLYFLTLQRSIHKLSYHVRSVLCEKFSLTSIIMLCSKCTVCPSGIMRVFCVLLSELKTFYLYLYISKNKSLIVLPVGFLLIRECTACSLAVYLDKNYSYCIRTGLSTPGCVVLPVSGMPVTS